MQAENTTLSTLQAQLLTLEAQGAGRLNPFLFHYCQALMHKIDVMSHHSASLIKKLNRPLNQLQVEFEQGKQQAEVQLERLINYDEKAYHHLKLEFQLGHFQAISRAEAKLQHTLQFAQHTLAPITALTQQLNKLSSERGRQRQSDHLDSFLQQADSALIDAIEGDENTGLLKAQPSEPEVLTLQSVQLFKQSQQQFNTAHLVQQAIADAPEEPGPLNPHMLTIRSLTLMQEFSPKYLERFVSYVDSVHWLEQHGDKIIAKAKKTGSA